MPKHIFISGSNDYFVTTWKTDNPGVSANNQITVPMTGGPYAIHRGDGSVDSGVFGAQTHTYSSPGTYTVKIRGVNQQISFNNGGDRQKILTIENRGITRSSFNAAFYGCSNLQLNATDIPQGSFTTMSRMFGSCSAFLGNASMNNWDVSNVTNFFQMFLNCGLFNQDIGNWDVSSATSMAGMFANAISFNQDISSWDVSSVGNFEQFLLNATSYNQPLNSWDVGSCTNFRQMFSGCTAFNQPLNSWNVSNGINMEYMFFGSVFNQPLNSWNTGSVQNMGTMFNACPFNQDISLWNTGNVTNMSAMFGNNFAFNQNIGGWDVSNVTNMSYMFYGSAFNQDIGSRDVSNVTNMTGMFDLGSLSIANYNALLIGRSALTLQNGVTLDVTQNYNAGAPATARTNIITNYSWTINDGGVI